VTDARAPSLAHHARVELTGRLEWWIMARVAVATLLLGGTVLLTSGTSDAASSFTHRLLIGLIVETYASSALAGLVMLRRRMTRATSAAIVALDVFAIALLLWVTDGGLSVFTVLLAVNVVVAALVVGARAAWAASITSLMVYMTISVGSVIGWLPVPPGQTLDALSLTSPELGVAILSNTAGLLLIPGLASMLASRLKSAGGQLRRAAADAAELARLNDDIVRCIASGLVTIDPSGRIRSINPAGAEILGGDDGSLIGEPIERYFPGLSLAGTGEARSRAELVGVRADGERFPVGYGANTLIDEAGNGSGTLLSFQDLTEIRRLRELAAREERLAALGRLSAGLAHEIRNPLSSISGSVELVRESNALGAEDAHLLRAVSVEVDRLNELVTTMLGFARTRDPRPVPIDLGDLLEDVAIVARASPVAREGVAIDAESATGVIALVDADQIRQVVWNLLKNALHVSPAGTRVSMSAARSGTACIITVRDRGPGLGDESEERLFDAFFTTRTQGVGLGLALVRQLVQRHGGAVEARNHPDGGALFQVTLPAVPTEP
jgi:two-component system, NtrC family, sensor histidine kinase PilS